MGGGRGQSLTLSCSSLLKLRASWSCRSSSATAGGWGREETQHKRHGMDTVEVRGRKEEVDGWADTSMEHSYNSLLVNIHSGSPPPLSPRLSLLKSRYFMPG